MHSARSSLLNKTFTVFQHFQLFIIISDLLFIILLKEAEQKGWRPRGQGCGWLNTMSGQGKCYPSVGKTQKVKCRVETCKQEIASQNYERHLRRFHPSENPKILRPYGQKVFSFGIEKAPAPPSNEDTGEDKESCTGEDQVAGKGKEGDINENYIDTLVSEAPAACRRRRRLRYH